jgi:hypothetical protein
MPYNLTREDLLAHKLRTESLRQDLLAYEREQNVKAEAALPLPAATPPGLNDAQKEQLFSSWIEYIDSRDPQSWTPAEKEAYRFNCARIVRTMQR